jgi:hypothetical protein
MAVLASAPRGARAQRCLGNRQLTALRRCRHPPGSTPWRRHCTAPSNPPLEPMIDYGITASRFGNGSAE